MKILAALAVVAAAAVAPGARATEVTVHVTGLSVVPYQILDQAERMANGMFVEAGVQIDWRNRRPSRSEMAFAKPLVIEMLDATPPQQAPGVFAYAMPYEGIHITVFYDRVQQAGGASATQLVLAHVLVHEITHILEGVARHSCTGVMKAHWALQDYVDMRSKPLPFAEEDLELIALGLAGRTSGSTLMAAAGR